MNLFECKILIALEQTSVHIRYLTQINKNQFGTRVKLKQCKSNSFCPVENDCYFFFLSNTIFTSIKFYIYDENFQLDILVGEILL